MITNVNDFSVKAIVPLPLNNLKSYKMKKLLIATAILFASAQANAQTKFEDTNPKVFVEFSPFLAAFNLVVIGGGLEWNKYSVGVAYTTGHHHFTHDLNVVTFQNFGDLHFLHTRSEDIFVKRYFNTNRTGFSVSALFNLTHWEVENHDEDKTKNITGVYGTLNGSYRWFPFQKYVYIEPILGVSYNFSGKETVAVGTESFNFNKQPFEITPEIKIGTRINLFKAKE